MTCYHVSDLISHDHVVFQNAYRFALVVQKNYCTVDTVVRDTPSHFPKTNFTIELSPAAVGR